MELLINKGEYEVVELDQLRTRLSCVALAQFSEIWLQGGASWPAICALINNRDAWLMYLRYEGDAGFSTRNPSYNGPDQAVIQYCLSNGQCDEYPSSWNITTTEALRGLEYFFEEKKMAPWLTWHED